MPNRPANGVSPATFAGKWRSAGEVTHHRSCGATACMCRPPFPRPGPRRPRKSHKRSQVATAREPTVVVRRRPHLPTRMNSSCWRWIAGLGRLCGSARCANRCPHEAGHRTASQASNSPVTDGEHVYAYFGSRGLYCVDLKGNIVWQKKFGRMETRRGFGEGSSPALYGDTLVVVWDHEGGRLHSCTRQANWRTTMACGPR